MVPVVLLVVTHRSIGFGPGVNGIFDILLGVLNRAVRFIFCDIGRNLAFLSGESKRPVYDDGFEFVLSKLIPFSTFDFFALIGVLINFFLTKPAD